MTNTTTINLGAFQFDDLNSLVIIPFTITSVVLGSQTGNTQSIPYAALASQTGNSTWQSTMPYSEIKSAIIAFFINSIGTIQVI